MKLYCLTSENLTKLGGPMGTEETWDNWKKYFTKIEYAKNYAEKDYGKTGKSNNLTWIKESKDIIRSDDMGFVMYHIEKVKITK